jgi:hypothetical protein
LSLALKAKEEAQMRDGKEDQERNDESLNDLSRRDFVALSLAAGLGAAASSASGAELPVIENNVEVKTPDGTCDAVFFTRRPVPIPGC